MRREIVGVDADDVLAHHAPAFIEFSNEHYGTDLKLEDYRHDWAEMWDIERPTIMKRARHFHEKQAHTFAPFSEAEETLISIKEKRDLVVVTARPDHLIPVTHEWMDQHYGGIFSEVHFVPIWEVGNEVTKADVCKQMGVDYLLDDMPKHCNLAAEVGVKALLFGGYSWNAAAELHPQVELVDSWKAVREYFDERD